MKNRDEEAWEARLSSRLEAVKGKTYDLLAQSDPRPNRARSLEYHAKRLTEGLSGPARFGLRRMMRASGPAMLLAVLVSVVSAPVAQGRTDAGGHSAAGTGTGSSLHAAGDRRPDARGYFFHASGTSVAVPSPISQMVRSAPGNAVEKGGATRTHALLGGQLSRPASKTPGPGADDGLLLTAADVPGFSVIGTGSTVGWNAVGGKLPKALTKAPTQGIGFKSGNQRLTAGVFVFGSSKQVTTVLKSVATGRKPVAVGTGGLLRNASTKKITDVAIVFRVGSDLGAVRFQATAAMARAPAIDAAYAKTLAARLARVVALTGWQRTLDGIRGDGSITPQLALQAFAIAYGPLPGMKQVPADAGAPTSATLAMQLVARVWNQLTAAQQTAIDRYLGAPHDAKTHHAAGVLSQVLTPDAHYQAIANKYNAIYHLRLPGTPPVQIKAFKASEDITTGTGRKAFADALSVNKSGDWGVGTPAYCRIRVPPQGQAASAQFQDLVMAHETFHCMQFVLMANWRQRTAWIMEGMADWAALTVDPVPVAVGGGNYKNYLSTPTTPLFARSYDAVGLWGHADEVGGKGSLWGKIPAILGAAGDPQSFAQAGGDGSPFVDTWASAAWRLPGAGPAWNQSDPYSLPVGAFSGYLPDYIGAGATLGSDPYTIREYAVDADPDRPLVHVIGTVGGAGTLRAGSAKEDFGPVISDWFCLGTCKCPPGEESTIPSNRSAGRVLALGLTGGSSAAAGSLTYHSLDEFCNKKVTGQGILLFQKSVNDGATVAAVFTKATCKKVTTKAHVTQFTAKAVSGAYQLSVSIQAFDGFHSYPLDFQSTNPYFAVDGPGGHFSNVYWPGGTPPNHGGYITFQPDGTVMGLGFINAWNTTFTDSIVLAGTVPCKYSK